MDLIKVVDGLAADRPGRVELKSERCLTSLDRFSDCSACVNACPTQALQAAKPPLLDVEKCVGCLACLPACPVDAFEAQDAVASLLSCGARVAPRPLDLLCEVHPDPRTAKPGSELGILLRGCLAGLGAGAYLGLAALGIERVQVRMDACAACPLGALQAEISAQVNTAGEILAAWGRSEMLEKVAALPAEDRHERPLWRAENPPISRRDLLRMTFMQGQSAEGRDLAAEEPLSGKQPPRDRRRLLRAVERLQSNQPGRSATPLPLAASFAMVRIADNCDACGACARACPTGALRYETQDDARYRLLFHAQACLACGLCLAACAPGAINIERKLTFGEVFGEPTWKVLSQDELVRCSRCGVLFPARQASRVCTLCQYREKNPFEKVLPPGVKARLEAIQKARST
ncbi:MAG: 4Fe-4S dicluster domain-containing protein [Anaerolineales bacterium]